MKTSHMIEPDTGLEFDAELGVALAESLVPAAPPAPLLDKLRRRILRRAATAPQDDLSLFTLRAQEGHWQRLAPGVEMKRLFEDDRSHAFLIRLEPGAVLPSHPHAVDEECLVLEGEIHLGDLHFRAGDYHVARAGSTHGLVTSPGGGVMYLRSAGPAGYQI